MDMSNKTEAIIAILAAFFVLFSAMLNPKISAGLAIVFLIILAAYKYIKVKQKEVARWRKMGCEKSLLLCSR